jgi:hypothetical protein
MTQPLTSHRERLHGLQGMDARDVHASILQMRKMLFNLDAWFEKAAAYAKSRSFDPVVFLDARLAPDHGPLVRHVQNACDRVKFAAARLSTKEAPRHPDTEQSIAEIRARIRVCADYLATFVESDFEGAPGRAIELPFLDGTRIEGCDYLRELAQPAFYFHVATTYAILRHGGVDLTMRDFIGGAKLRKDC